jgi:hypothetical protein
MTKDKMRSRSSLTFVVLILLLPASMMGQTKSRAVVLPETAADQVIQLCSRPGPPKFSGAWKPTEADIQKMEAHLSRIAGLRTESGVVGVQIEHPDRYYRQYVGIIIENRKFVFINAFCNDKPTEDWGERIIDYCDGGCSWGVVYDIGTGKFYPLEMNGVP